MNIHHFEQLMITFREAEMEDGESGFDIKQAWALDSKTMDMHSSNGCSPSYFREVFGKVLGGNLSHDQMTMLFMKIDANSDGTVDWDEFSTYMMSAGQGALGIDENAGIFDDRTRRQINTPNKDMIKRIDYIAKERKYITVSRDGAICLWSPKLKLQKTIYIKDFTPGMSWIADAVYMQDHNKLVIITDDRQLYIYEVLSIKPRIVVTISQLEYNPLCISYAGHYDEDTDLILFGDDGGYVNILTITRRFLVDCASDGELSEPWTLSKLSKKDSLKRNNVSFFHRKVHNDWVLKVQYYQEMNAFVSCTSEPTKSLVIGDLERKTARYIHVPKGIKCFDFCRRPSFLVTGGRDKIVRLWNPYVLSKPAGSLYGHNAAIVNIIVNHENSHVLSLSEDKVVKIWNARNLNCLQTLTDKLWHRPENIISAIYFDQHNHQLLTGSNRLEIWPQLYKNLKQSAARSHDAPVVGGMFNENFHQVVSACQLGTVSIWDLGTGEKIFQFNNAHGKLEITCMCFDRSRRRLITGSRDGIIKMWNFNNGQILRKMVKDNTMEATDGANKYIITVGWDRKITIFLDDSSHFEARPVRVLNGIGSGAQRGHEDDISSVAFCPPNSLATGSMDGVIVVWNLESGYIKVVMREPFLELRSTEERAVEKIMFLVNLDDESEKSKAPLVSCHSDGCLRFWDALEGKMICEMNCQSYENEGLTSMALNPEVTILFVGGSFGHVRIFDIKLAHFEAKRSHSSGCVLRKEWRAHVQTITGVNYVNTQDVVLTSSKDCTIRAWTLQGVHIGIFGQDQPWDLSDPATYMSAPTDTTHETQLEEQRKEMMSRQKELLKKNVIETWRELAHREFTSDEEDKLFLERLKRLRSKAIQTHVTKKWKEYCIRRRNAQDWMITDDLRDVQYLKQSFFKFDSGRRHRHGRLNINAKHDSVYHMIECHPLDDIPNCPMPGIKPKATKAHDASKQANAQALRRERTQVTRQA
ncbi:WD40-repeat-containing domain protein [Polychytrium aggregatum]|uniref:WD40-repeat-containing domain protein n=1 Tax=Polychytrium aggregatum TaxID=110093 RepID=UPI0022FF1A83|nr:WD40-repeat-containing domain protein [Polychytrium aggregatum]KAI9204974.1 WD40-repeat-containing domain protein [Polychytrium aggregatum]